MSVLITVKKSGHVTAFTPENEYQLSIQFFLIGHGLPREDNPALCIAVAPSTAADHPRNRPALEPSSPLPWPGCYLYTICDLYPLVSRIHHDPAVPPRMITLEQRRQVLMCSLPDQREAQRPGPVLVRTADAEQRPADDSESWPIHSESDSESSSDDKPEDEDEAEELRRLVAIQRKVDKVQIQVEMWMDPSLIPDLEPATLGDPEKLYPLLDRLKEISQDYQNRMLAKVLTKPHTNEWIEAVACAQDSVSAADEGERDQGSEGEQTMNDASPPEGVTGTGAPSTSTSMPADATNLPLPAPALPPTDDNGPFPCAGTDPRTPRGTTLSPGSRLARVWRYITRPFSKTRRSHVQEGSL
ncbi:hypothetical protein EXIGLDRAFT_524231 [Exidia glandulosa HHB12029]|uniref:Uncharacterized protein n=1 Tax=Exidia glandulosa HHB12029 TaxID=1314781 RepID=A0A165J166_EXIGL|nr:hypothetical protein EXIGLDRAFT_524231 [Exidia glandulosa HHB12029]